MTELSSEDSFRLNVLLANKLQAIRIDESKMIVWGLSEAGEAKVPLTPTGRPEQYLRKVRELISGHILGSPGGYPIYLRRWTRMGQMRDESLEQLLMLGEPEAVVAAVCSPGLTDELARRAWWAMDDAENARRMLCNEAVVRGEMGRVLAEYLVEFLPFETETDKMMESVRLVLQPGLIDEETKDSLWRKSARKQAYLVGFLQALPDQLPASVPARAEREAFAAVLDPLEQAGNSCARLLNRVLSSSGQAFMKTASDVLAKPPTQDVVQAVLDLLRGYCSALRPGADPDLPLDDLVLEAREYVLAAKVPGEVPDCLASAPALAPEVVALRVLSGLGYGVLRPVLRDSTATGSLMRRKLQPVVEPIRAQLAVLAGRGG